MTELVDDFDYTTLAGLRGTTVTLCDVTVHQCAYCAPSTCTRHVEIPQMAELHRNIAAAKVLHAKHLRFDFLDDAWTVFLPLKGESDRPVRAAPRPKKRPTEQSKKLIEQPSEPVSMGPIAEYHEREIAKQRAAWQAVTKPHQIPGASLDHSGAAGGAVPRPRVKRG